MARSPLGQRPSGPRSPTACRRPARASPKLPPKLAVGLAAEAAGDLATAARFLSEVWAVDHSYVSAAFGLGRVRSGLGDVAGAVAALSAVPASSQYLAAQVAALRPRLPPPAGQSWVSAAELQQARRQLARTRSAPELHERLTSEFLLAALARVLGGQPVEVGSLPGIETSVRALRFGREKSYREQARLAGDARRRVALVDMANSIRPRTWS